MAEDKTKHGSPDPFIAIEIFPEAEQIFTFKPKKIVEINEDCVGLTHGIG